MRSVDGRLRDLLEEVESVLSSNDGRGKDNRRFKAWRSRAEAAVGEKLGTDSPLFQELHELDFEYAGPWFDGMTPVDETRYFAQDLDTAAAIVEAALEAELAPRGGSGPSSPIVSIHQVGPSASSSSTATAEVRLDGSAEGLRRLIAETGGLTREERGAAIGAVPDDDEPIDLEQIETLLSIATKAKPLLAGVSGWLLANLDRLPLP